MPKRLNKDQAEQWLAKTSALHCKSERQAAFMVSLATGDYKKMLVKALIAQGFLQDAQVS